MKYSLKYYLAITTLMVILSINCLQSQTFVNDIDRVAVVVIDYCVDANGKRYSIQINKEKTTYLNEGWQLGSLEHFKNAKLFVPMKMTNECWQSVYYFVNETYKNSSLPKNKQVKCRVFHTGEYRYQNPAYSNTVMKRRKRKQIELSPDKDQRQVYGIEWITDHIYTLKTLKLPLAKDKHKIGNLIIVEIIEIIGDSYLYKSHIKGDDNVIFGIIDKVQ